MKIVIDLLICGITSFVFIHVMMPFLRKTARKIQLVDKPNFRKVHTIPVPLIGGIAIALATSFSLLTSYRFVNGSPEPFIMLGASIVLLITGVLDDKMDIRAIYKFIIQLGCAYFIAASGIRITTMYGIFGINTLPVLLQYFLTMIVIAGVVNAFNLMDGIDGLAGSLATIGFIVLAVLSYIMGDNQLTVMYTAFVGSLIGFLRFNLGKNKIFMGDGGSLFLGFILVVSGLKMLKPVYSLQHINPDSILMIIVGIFLLPVLDSLRVYRGRIKNGDSPFKADKNHIHHLFLLLGFNHKSTSLAISISTVCILVLTLVLSMFFRMTTVLLIVVLAFTVMMNILNTNKSLHIWMQKIRDMENR